MISKLHKKLEEVKARASHEVADDRKGELGQFFTSSPICLYMSSLFNDLSGNIKLLDPGCGPGGLTLAFLEEALNRKECESIQSNLFEVDARIAPYTLEALNHAEGEARDKGIVFQPELKLCDFILDSADTQILESTDGIYTHCIMNPPYKKISSKSDHRKALKQNGIETVNLYTGFVALALQQLKVGGELVAIIPRSFCNGSYYQPFREFLLEHSAIQKIHIFESRKNAFSEDKVLQENIIIHLVKGAVQRDVIVTCSPVADFTIDEDNSSVAASDMTIRQVEFEKIVNPKDPHKFIHIATTQHDQKVIDRISHFSCSLEDLSLEVSTGPVVDFRLKADLRENIDKNSVPLLYPVHLGKEVTWPKDSKKPNAINVSDKSRGWLWTHTGNFIITKRFSSKEERRRIVATFYESNLDGNLIGFENKLNVFHANKVGFSKNIALGLYVYLNSTLLDKYYRIFGGHTQVNATDLRNIPYPSPQSLERIGSQINSAKLEQEEIDELIEKEIYMISGDAKGNPLNDQAKIDQCLSILVSVGMPRAQQNERSALTLLALLNLGPDSSWENIEKPMIGVTPIMDWIKSEYGKEYAPNTRETIRRQTLHQFVDGGIVLYNPDKPNRPVNSPKACYQITPELYDTLRLYGTDKFEAALGAWLENRKTLAAQYAMEREMEMIPLTLDDGTEITLSPGDHSQLISDIVTDFGPRFVPGAEVIYLGDTGAKEDFFRKDRLGELGVVVDRKGKLPDVVLYWPEKDWLLLIESVTSHGPVDGKRHGELSELFKDSNPGLVFVTAFPSKKLMGKYLADISWETEVWVADAPTHMIHFNGVRFLGPY